MSQAACDVFCVGDDVNIEKANNSLISNDRSWKRNKFRLTYVAEAPELTQGTAHRAPGEVLGPGGEDGQARRGEKVASWLWSLMPSSHDEHALCPMPGTCVLGSRCAPHNHPHPD